MYTPKCMCELHAETSELHKVQLELSGALAPGWQREPCTQGTGEESAITQGHSPHMALSPKDAAPTPGAHVPTSTP